MIKIKEQHQVEPFYCPNCDKLILREMTKE